MSRNVLSSECKEEWLDELEDFRTIIYPKIFQPFGFTLSEAYISWQMNLLKNAIHDVEEKVSDDKREEF